MMLRMNEPDLGVRASNKWPESTWISNARPFRIVQEATMETEHTENLRKSSARQGGLRGGPLRSSRLVDERREIARTNAVPWNKQR